MPTRATIEFSDHRKKFYVYRHFGGYPEQVMPDIMSAIEKSRGLWGEPEVGLLVSFFIGLHSKEERIPDYEITSGFHEDENYRYFVKYNQEYRFWEVKHE